MTRLRLAAALIPLMAGCAPDTRMLDLRRIDRSAAPNDALACPARACRATPDFTSPVFSTSRKALMDHAMAVAASQPRTELVRRASGPDRAVFVQRSRLFGFPDTIWIQAAGRDARASLIIYSRAAYGYWDLGVNRDRVRAWLDALSAAGGPARSPHGR